ncbi:MAG TPA: DNA methyltransferase [Polyangiaceae bacterium]|nr:DNA methyltransferase [Polyangiaceae bacterium]
MRPHLLAGPVRELRESLPQALAGGAQPIDPTQSALAHLLRSAADRVYADLVSRFGPGLLDSFEPPSSDLASSAEWERMLSQRLAADSLGPAWLDDTSLGWIYQFWHEADRIAIDARLDAQHKLEPQEIATKTQVFTERYMIDWLLQNSLGTLWTRVCQRHGWRSQVLARWPYFKACPEPDSTESLALPQRLNELKLLDPACGAGHFLVVAVDYLLSLYREEAVLSGQGGSDREFVESILENNLFGIDLDARAVRVAASSLLLKSLRVASDARPRRLNLVGTEFATELARIQGRDPLYEQLAEALSRAKAPATTVSRVLALLSSAAHLGTLLKVNLELDAWLTHSPHGPEVRRALEQLLTTHTRALGGARALDAGSETGFGLRALRAQEPDGLLFWRLTNERQYHVICGNPPYFGTQSIADASYLDRRYPESRENLCTALLDRAMELVLPGGLLAFVTQRNWLYVRQLQYFRRRMLETFAPFRVADLELGGFESLKTVDGILWVARGGSSGSCWVTRAPAPEPTSKAAALREPRETYVTHPSLLARLPGSPFVYRWPREFAERYLSEPLLGERYPVRVGMKTSDNLRFVRYPWELPAAVTRRAAEQPAGADWVPYIKGAEGKTWIEPLSHLVCWREHGLEIRIALEAAYQQKPQAEKYFFKRGVAFNTIGRSFVARAHRYASLFDVAGSSVFPDDLAEAVCLLNSRFAREIVESLNPTINFQVGDVARIPARRDPEARALFALLESAFETFERSDETSFRFQRPAATTWIGAQAYAARAVNRPEGAALPEYEPDARPPTPEAAFSYAFGVAIGRFDAQGKGWLDTAPSSALPHGLLFIGQLGHDSLQHPAARGVLETFAGLRASPTAPQSGTAPSSERELSGLRKFLRREFFTSHRKQYRNRPIYLPLASSQANFVAFVSVHGFNPRTLRALVDEYLTPELACIEAALVASEPPHAASEQPRASAASSRSGAELAKLRSELVCWIRDIGTVASVGPWSPDALTPPREVDAEFLWEMDDGVLVNSAALWPLLAPLWSEPKKWWSQLARRSGPKGCHFDWSRTARRYFPQRVERACAADPVVASAHGELERYHPQLATRWRERLQELGDQTGNPG